MHFAKTKGLLQRSPPFRGSCAEKALSGLHPTQYAIGTLAEFSDLGPQMGLISLVWIWISILKPFPEGNSFLKEILIWISTRKVELGKILPPGSGILQKQRDFSNEVARSVAAVQKGLQVDCIPHNMQ